VGLPIGAAVDCSVISSVFGGWSVVTGDSVVTGSASDVEHVVVNSESKTQ